jgi:hypothetical protein
MGATPTNWRGLILDRKKRYRSSDSLEFNSSHFQILAFLNILN